MPFFVASLLVACTAAVPCLINGKRYSPDMEGGERTNQKNALACKKHCENLEGKTKCKYFSFWPDGGCHLSDESAQLQSDPYGAISGDRECTATLVSCGGHFASDCGACPRGHGRDWCNGDCMWDDKKVDEEEACREKSDPKP